MKLLFADEKKIEGTARKTSARNNFRYDRRMNWSTLFPPTFM
jgi:hypothetical protein